MGSAVSSVASIGGSLGGAIGGLIGQSAASGDASQASNEAGIANSIMQNMAAVPTIDQPLVLEQYRQAGVLTPAMEQQINLGVSQASQVKANPALQAAQTQALQSMAQRSQMGLTASDRAAFNQLQQQVGSQTQGRLQAIQQQQQAQTGGQGTQGATLAAKLSASQGGANTEAMNADQLAAQASNNALQATAQYGSMAGQQNQQQFGQQMQAAQAADSFRQFDVQNQVAQQQRNVAASNQAQQYNLNLGQNVANANVSQANQAQLTQRQLAAQQWGMQYQQATGQSAAAAGYGNTLSGMASQIAQAGANLGAGLGGAAGAAAGAAGGGGGGGGGGSSGGGDGGEEEAEDSGGEYSGGEIKGYDQGGQVNPYASFSTGQINPIPALQSGPMSAQKFQQFVMPQRQMTTNDFGAAANAKLQAALKTPVSKNAKPTAPSAQGQQNQNSINNAPQLQSPQLGQETNTPDASQGALGVNTSLSGDQSGQQSQGMLGVDTSSLGNSQNNAAIQSAAAQDAGMDEQSYSNAINQGQQQSASDTDPDTNMSVQGSIDPSETDQSVSQGDSSYQNQAHGGQIDYRRGGKVPGKPVVKGDNPKNDIVPARLSPGEIVLPRSIAMKLKNAPDGDFNDHLNKIVGPFIRKSQKMADGGQVMEIPKPLPQVAQTGRKNRFADGGEIYKPTEIPQQERQVYKRPAEEEMPEPDSVPSSQKSKKEETNRAGYSNQSSNNNGYHKGGKVKDALSMLKNINGYADGTDDVQQDDPNATPLPDTDDSGDDVDTAVVRANPDTDSDIDQVAQNEFQEDQSTAPSDDDSQEPDRSQQPADLEAVEKDDDKSPEDEKAKTDAVEQDFKDKEQNDQKPDLTNEDIAKLDSESPSSTSDDEQPMKSPEGKLSDLQQQLKRAQAQRQAILMGTQGAKYGALIAAGLAGHGARPVGAEYFNSDKLAELPVKNLQESLTLEKDDPTSAISKFYRKRLEQSLNMKIASDVSASGMEKMFPQVTKIVGSEYQLNAKKQMAEIAQQNKMSLLDHKNQWQQQQNDLNRQSQLQGHKMMADAMGQRATIPAVTAALKDVENDPVVKPLRVGQQALSLSKSMLENPDVPVTPQLLNDASNGFTQALALRPGAVTQKRYDQTSINTMKSNVARFIGKYADQPDIDMRKVDPNLYNTLHNYVNTLHDDYNTRLQSERNRLIKEKGAAYTAAGVPNVTAGVSAIGNTGATGMTPPPAPRTTSSAPVPGQTPGRIVIRKGYNPKTNQTQFIYDDGTKETKPGKL